MTLDRPSESYRRSVDGPTLGNRARRIDPLVWDTLLAVALAALSVIGGIIAANGSSDPARQGLGTAPFVLVALGCAPLVVRRRWPIGVLIAVSLTSVASASIDHSQDLAFALVVASYTAAAYVDRERFVRITVPIAVGAAVAGTVIADPNTNWVEVLVATTFSTGLPMLFGRIGYNRRRRIAAEQERAARDAVTHERARIARELHDVVAHAMSVMVVQAGAARRVLDDDPASARAAIARIEATGRDGMAEMRRLIGILKEDAAHAERTPQPGLADLDALLETVRASGVAVELVNEGQPQPLSSGADLTAFRVVQEALTNVMKHAGRANARVLLRWLDDALEIEVADDGRGPTTAAPGGQGLIGMRERVALFDGTLTSGARPGGGFALRAVVPIEHGAAP
jgi:signal transduction histidine kinase